MFSIGNEELSNLPDITEYIICNMCGKKHRVEYGYKILKDGTKVSSKLLGFFRCKDKSYLASVAGKDIRKIK